MTLKELGWRPMLQQQLSLEELECGYAARVSAVFRDRIELKTLDNELSLPITGILASADPIERPTTGDWLWLENHSNKALKLFERLNVLQRTAAGSEAKSQLIAVNIDTLFIVSSCNQDFNVSRIERYLTLVLAAHIPAVIVLTKTDLCADADSYAEQAQAIHHDVPVIKVNALTDDIGQAFSYWTGVGQTIAFLGSSGVGKSTLTNALLGQQIQDTAGIREDDAKGRHTTTGRSLFAMPNGGWVLDTPGMRELRLNDDLSGVAEVFDDIEALQKQCKFNNCRHEDDQGCAIQAALEAGTLELRRWQNYQKLHREALRARQTKHEQHEHGRKFGKEIRQALKGKKAKRNWADQ
ncbi:MAG: ribosome small subunit-dependent GTPase A [Paraglaciecola sp.]|uniref:ribosome small subunit-dependent GTPase A n=1 Tax=Paraglaciecola sp. TaxID=1920173 RepID=UPI00273DAD64|nr:ribosome small subunit-dependent GTPase A [Paraglaciecola sp.]MDP5033227.1 ribosome small subunit-dependent GTPase A [Paraglaciecola sp.]MDP5130380.1 ribosome small subunit-dependent GTPase A [Paraglaciecola sp.]